MSKVKPHKGKNKIYRRIAASLLDRPAVFLNVGWELMRKTAAVLALSLIFSSFAFGNEIKDKAMKVLEKQIHPETRESAQPFVDYLSEAWLNANVFEAGVPAVFLALGNSSQQEWDSSFENDVVQAVLSLREKGYSIAYDEDSPVLSRIVRETVRERFRLGISAGQPKRGDSRVITLVNPYMRLSLLRSFKSIFVSPDSTLGVGLFLEGLGSQFKLVGFKDQIKSLRNWAKSLSDPTSGLVSYGIRFSKAESKARLVEWVSLMPRVPEIAFIPFDLSTYIEQGHDQDGFRILKAALEFRAKFERNLSLVKNENGQALAKGAVMFGSGSGGPLYRPWVRFMVAGLASENIWLSTGGDGGYMADAHQAAAQRGLRSVGIPILRRCEKRPNQTLTLCASDYTDRIPLLLAHKSLIVFAPGGSGTVRELATSLVHSSLEPENKPLITFLHQGYYGGLVEWFKSSQLPENLKSRFRLVDTLHEMNEVVRELGQDIPQGVLSEEAIVFSDVAEDGDTSNERWNWLSWLGF